MIATLMIGLGTAGTAVLAALAYFLAVAGSLIVFLRATARVLRDEGHTTAAERAGFGAGLVVVVFFILGGLVWFRFVSVGMLG